MSEKPHASVLFFALFALLTVGAQPLSAQYAPPRPTPTQPFTGEVTVTATGVETDVDEAPTAVTVITRDEIDDAQAASVAEMLRRVPGLTVLSSGDEGKVTSVAEPGRTRRWSCSMVSG